MYDYTHATDFVIDDAGNLQPTPVVTNFDGGLPNPPKYDFGPVPMPPAQVNDGGQVITQEDAGGTQAIIQPEAMPPVPAQAATMDWKKYLPWIIGGAAVIYLLTRKK
jgi:hypothetical protein